MTNNPMKHKMLWKTAQNGLFAHIYEHSAAQAIDIRMAQEGLFFVSDYDLFANTYGATCFLEATFYNEVAEKTFEIAINEFQSSDLLRGPIHETVQQCSIEYQRPLVDMTDQLEVTMIELHKQTWLDIKDFSSEQAKDSTSVNTLFDTDGITFGDVTPAGFRELTIEYGVDKTVTETPAKKALAVITTQALALNFFRYLADKSLFYDIGDEWAYGSSEVGYRTTIRTPRDSTVEPSHIKDQFEQFVSENIDGLAQSIAKLLKFNYSTDHSAIYFGQKHLNEILGGATVGGKGWESVASKELTAETIRSTQITAYEL